MWSDQQKQLGGLGVVCFNSRVMSYQYRNSHDKATAVTRPSYLYNKNPYSFQWTTAYIPCDLMLSVPLIGVFGQVKYTVFRSLLSQLVEPGELGKWHFWVATRNSYTLKKFIKSFCTFRPELNILWFYRQHLKMHFCLLVFWFVFWIKFYCVLFLIVQLNRSALLQVMTWHQTGDKPFHEATINEIQHH